MMNMVSITFANDTSQPETIKTTLEHPFHVAGQGFVAAEHLKAGMVVSRWSPSASPLQTVGFRAAEAATGHLLVKAITITRSGLKKWRAYNLTVEGDHTYFVGKTNAWVHNVNCPKWESATRLDDWTNLSPKQVDELASGRRLAKELGVEARVSPRDGPDGDFIGPNGRLWDILGRPGAFGQYWNPAQFSNSITGHVNKQGIDLVLDLTHASSSQRNQILDFVANSFTKAQRDRITWLVN